MQHFCKIKISFGTRGKREPEQLTLILPFHSKDPISNYPHWLPCNSCGVGWYFSLFSRLDCMILYWYCKEKFSLGHSWELKD